MLDTFIPRPDIRERFENVIDAPVDLVYEVARDFDAQSLPLVKAIFWLRAKMTGATPVTRRPQSLVAETQALGWGLLHEQPGRLFVAGAICQPWLADVKFRALPASEFASHVEPDHVKIVWTLEATPVGPTQTRFASETRVVATDEEARGRFRRYWRWARFGIISIRLLILPGVKRAAEAEWRRRSAAG